MNIKLTGSFQKGLFPVHTFAVRFDKNSKSYASMTYSEEASYWMNIDIGGVTGKLTMTLVTI